MKKASFGRKKFFFPKIFSRKFFYDKIGYFKQKKKKFNFFPMLSQNIFQVILKKTTFLNIFFNRKSGNVKIGKDLLFLMLYNKKQQNLKKKLILRLFLKNQFFIFFKNLNFFLDKKVQKFFFSHFPKDLAPNNLFMQKKLGKIIFGGMR